MELESLVRLRRGLAGAAVSPPVAGLTFVDPALLPGRGGPDASPGAALAHACARSRLDFAFVPSWEPWAVDAVRELRALGVASLWVSRGVLWPALDSVGPSAGLRLVARSPRDLGPALDAAVSAARAAVLNGVDAGADGFVVADDLAGASGPIVDPAFLREAVFPRLGAVATAARATGAPALLHCDGAVETLYDEMRAVGFAGVHGDCGGRGRIEQALVAARAAGLGLVGGLSTAEMVDTAHGEAAGTRVATTARRGGLVIADDGGISTRDGCVALIAALAAVRRQ